MQYAASLLREYEVREKILKDADEIVLYGKSPILPVMQIALNDLGIFAKQRVFDKGRFDGDESDCNAKQAIILCGMRAKTRQSMMRDAGKIFPDSVSGDLCFDFFAIYYKWITEIIKRDCDYEELARTLLLTREENAEENVIFNIDAINSSFCNLSCKECGNGIPYRSEKKFVPAERLINSLKNLTKVMPIAYCNVQGGEPLIDKNLTELLIKIANNPKIAFITVATNGTLLPSDSVMDAMRKTGATFRISDYGILSAKKDELREAAKKFSVPSNVYERAKSWLSYGKFESHSRSKDENTSIAKSCFFGTKNLMLYDGALYCCCRTLFVNALGVDNEAVRENSLNVFENFSFDDLSKILTGSNLYKMCDFCDYPMRTVPPATQLKI